MKKYGALLLLMAAMLVAVPGYNLAQAAQRGPDQNSVDGRGPHHGYGQAQFTPEQRNAFDKIMKDHFDKTQGLRNDLWAKQTELDYLVDSNNADPKTINKMVGEIKTMREKLQAEHKSCADKLTKELGINPGQAYAMMPGSCDGPRMSKGCGGQGWGRGEGHRGGYHGGGYHNGGYHRGGPRG